jgi:hypothetical protein
MAGVHPRLIRMRYRLLAYFFLWTLVFPVFAIGLGQLARRTWIEPRCAAYAREHGLGFVSYSQGGGDPLGLTSTYSSPACYFSGGPQNYVPLREVGGTALHRLALYEGILSVMVGFVLATVLLVALGFAVEKIADRFQSDS